MQALLRYFEQAAPSPALHRMRFVLRFLESMGLRASELLAARLGDLVHELGRYRRGHLGVAPEVADLRITGSFPLHDTDKALSALLPTLPVQIERQGQTKGETFRITLRFSRFDDPALRIDLP